MSKFPRFLHTNAKMADSQVLFRAAVETKTDPDTNAKMADPQVLFRATGETKTDPVVS